MSHEQLARTFDAWAADGRDSSMEEEHGNAASQVLERMGLKPGEQVLDLGCGNGWATRALAKAAPGVSAVGVDVSPGMIARAEELHSFTIRARYEACPFEALDLPDGKFDRVFSMEALYYAADLEQALAEMLRVMKPGATADVLIDYYTDSPATAKWDDAVEVEMHAKSEAEWVQTFEAAGFTNLRTERVIDTRGPGDPSAFQPDCCYPDFETWRAVHEAGTLWIHAAKPA